MFGGADGDGGDEGDGELDAASVGSLLKQYLDAVGAYTGPQIGIVPANWAVWLHIGIWIWCIHLSPSPRPCSRRIMRCSST